MWVGPPPPRPAVQDPRVTASVAVLRGLKEELQLKQDLREAFAVQEGPMHRLLAGGQGACA